MNKCKKCGHSEGMHFYNKNACVSKRFFKNGKEKWCKCEKFEPEISAKGGGTYCRKCKRELCGCKKKVGCGKEFSPYKNLRRIKIKCGDKRFKLKYGLCPKCSGEGK